MDKKPKKWFIRNLANIITLSAFPLCLVLLWVVIFHRDWTTRILLLVIGIFLTDFLDGKTARCLGTTSTFGGALDRLRDKAVIGIVFLFLILDERIHISLKIITVPMAVVETILLVYWFMGLKKKLDVSTVKSADKYGSGQIKMFLLSAAILFCLLNIIMEEHYSKAYHMWTTLLLNVMFVVSLFFAIKSYLAHKTRYKKQTSAE